MDVIYGSPLADPPNTTVDYISKGSQKMEPPGCFISYSWDSDKHKEWVCNLATRFRECGVDAILDQWFCAPGTDLTKFMKKSVRESKYVVLVCTPTIGPKPEFTNFIKHQIEKTRLLQPKVINSIGMEFVLIPEGKFQMGSAISPEETVRRYGGEIKWFKAEHPRHSVEISRSFYLQKTEVTQGHWKKVMGDNPSYFKVCGDDCPVENVSWNDTQKFIKKLNVMVK